MQNTMDFSVWNSLRVTSLSIIFDPFLLQFNDNCVKYSLFLSTLYFDQKNVIVDNVKEGHFQIFFNKQGVLDLDNVSAISNSETTKD